MGRITSNLLAAHQAEQAEAQAAAPSSSSSTPNTSASSTSPLLDDTPKRVNPSKGSSADATSAETAAYLERRKNTPRAPVDPNAMARAIADAEVASRRAELAAQWDQAERARLEAEEEEELARQEAAEAAQEAEWEAEFERAFVLLNIPRDDNESGEESSLDSTQATSPSQTPLDTPPTSGEIFWAGIDKAVDEENAINPIFVVGKDVKAEEEAEQEDEEEVRRNERSALRRARALSEEERQQEEREQEQALKKPRFGNVDLDTFEKTEYAARTARRRHHSEVEVEVEAAEGVSSPQEHRNIKRLRTKRSTPCTPDTSLSRSASSASVESEPWSFSSSFLNAAPLLKVAPLADADESNTTTQQSLNEAAPVAEQSVSAANDSDPAAIEKAPAPVPVVAIEETTVEAEESKIEEPAVEVAIEVEESRVEEPAVEVKEPSLQVEAQEKLQVEVQVDSCAEPMDTDEDALATFIAIEEPELCAPVEAYDPSQPLLNLLDNLNNTPAPQQQPQELALPSTAIDAPWWFYWSEHGAKAFHEQLQIVEEGNVERVVWAPIDEDGDSFIVDAAACSAAHRQQLALAQPWLFAAAPKVVIPDDDDVEDLFDFDDEDLEGDSFMTSSSSSSGGSDYESDDE